MVNLDFIEKLKERLQKPLPGKNAQVQMAPEFRIETLFSEDDKHATAKKAAVLISLYQKDSDLYTALIKRTTYDGVHSGQIAFPGGRWETYDETLVQTALREAEEEVNIEQNKVVVLGTLTPLYVPPSNFLILPVVGYVPCVPHFIEQKDEVESVVEVPFNSLNKAENKGTTKIQLREGLISVPCFYANNEIIWGATAMVISELNQVVAEL